MKEDIHARYLWPVSIEMGALGSESSGSDFDTATLCRFLWEAAAYVQSSDNSELMEWY